MQRGSSEYQTALIASGLCVPLQVTNPSESNVLSSLVGHSFLLLMLVVLLG